MRKDIILGSRLSGEDLRTEASQGWWESPWSQCICWTNEGAFRRDSAIAFLWNLSYTYNHKHVKWRMYKGSNCSVIYNSKILKTIKITVKRMNMLSRYSYGKFSKMRTPVKNHKMQNRCSKCYNCLSGEWACHWVGCVCTKYSFKNEQETNKRHA